MAPYILSSVSYPSFSGSSHLRVRFFYCPPPPPCHPSSPQSPPAAPDPVAGPIAPPPPNKHTAPLLCHGTLLHPTCRWLPCCPVSTCVPSWYLQSARSSFMLVAAAFTVTSFLFISAMLLCKATLLVPRPLCLGRPPLGGVALACCAVPVSLWSSALVFFFYTSTTRSGSGIAWATYSFVLPSPTQVGFVVWAPCFRRVGLGTSCYCRPCLVVGGYLHP